MRLPSEKCVNGAKSSTANAKTRFPSRNVALFAFLRNVFARLWSFRSIDAFLTLQKLFPLGKSDFAFAISAETFSPMRATSSLGIGCFAFQSYVFARETHFR